MREILKNKNVWICILVALLLFSVSMCSKKSGDVRTLKQNLVSACDTLRVYRLENNSILAEKNAYVVNSIKKETYLLEQLGVAKSEIDLLKKKLGSEVNTITKIETEIVYDTITTETIKYQQAYKFDYNSEWLKFSGTCDSTQLKIYNINIPVDLVVGTTGNNKIFVESKNPYLQINNITGMIQEQKTSKWDVGIGIGIGAQYGIINKKFDIGPQINCGIIYRF